MTHIKKEDLKVGMIVQCGDENYNATACWKVENVIVPFRITEIKENKNVLRISVKGEEPDASSLGCICGDLDHLYLVNNSNPIQFDKNGVTLTGMTLNGTLLPDIRFLDNNSNPRQTIMSKLIEKFRQLTATPDEKLLISRGIENPLGVPTSEGYMLLQEILYRENRAKVIDVVRKIDDEEKASEVKK